MIGILMQGGLVRALEVSKPERNADQVSQFARGSEGNLEETYVVSLGGALASLRTPEVGSR